MFDHSYGPRQIILNSEQFHSSLNPAKLENAESAVNARLNEPSTSI